MSAIALVKSRATRIETARKILSETLRFADPSQIEAREFVEMYETASALVKPYSDFDRYEIWQHYEAKCLEDLDHFQLQDLIAWLEEED